MILGYRHQVASLAQAAISRSKPLPMVARLPIGVAKGVRNTPSLLDTGFSRWFGWAGANDTLWGASIRPITAAAEMASAAEHVQTLITTDTTLAAAFTQTFGASAKAMGAEPALMAVW